MVEIPTAGDYVTPENYTASLEELADDIAALQAQTAEILPDMIERVNAPNIVQAGRTGDINGKFTQTYQYGGIAIDDPSLGGDVDIDISAPAMTGILRFKAWNGNGAAASFWTETISVSTTTATVRCMTPAGALTTGPVQIDWEVTGWI